MLSFQQLVLRKFILLFFILFTFIGVITYYWVKNFYVEQAKASLIQDIEIITFEIDKSTNLDKLALQIKNKLNTRITIIDIDGEIITESHKNKITMDNHKYRPEIMQARKEAYGYKIRYSKTLGESLLYIAKKYRYNNHTVYIRLAKELKNINAQIFSLGINILAILIVFFIGIFIITYKINIQIQNETQKIANFLRDLASKKKSTYINSDFSTEFALITKLLTKISLIIVKREKQKSKYTTKLEASNNQKDDIISAISHEFKNPIAVINGYSQTLLDDEELNIDIRNKFLKKIYNNGNKLSELIDTLRLSIKLDGGHVSINFATINLYDLINDAVENIKLTYPNRVAIIQGDKTIQIKADRTLLGVLITNLVENAFKYSEDEVHIKFDNESLRVTDSGIGINKKDLQNITDKFYRVHKNSWNNSLGLGLFIVNNISNLHNFKLHIESEENIGSTFSINF
ncbi:MAG: ATP-binding protein [Sulfurimonas sp.]